MAKKPPKHEKAKTTKTAERPGEYPIVDGVKPIVYYPSKFCPGTYDPKWCDQLIEHAETGLSFEAFGATARVSKQTLYEWVKKYPEFADAKKLFESISLKWWEQTGMDGMNNKTAFFKTAVWIYNMRNRFGWKDARNNDGQETQVPGDEVYDSEWGSNPPAAHPGMEKS